MRRSPDGPEASVTPHVTVTAANKDEPATVPIALPAAHAPVLNKARKRRGSLFRRSVRVNLPDNEDEKPPSAVELRRRHVAEYQMLWNDIDRDLPPQLSRRHITMISIGGVIGTGVFLGVAQALFTGGPVGLLLGYSIVGTIVYAVVVSVAEIVAWLPNVGGIVRLADLYVDPALGFAMGWNAWYNWAVILPAEISAATVLMRDFFIDPMWNPVVTTAVLVVAVGINCFGARLYGNVEFWFAMGKIITIVILIFVSIYLDLQKGADGRIGFRYWKDPGPFGQYKDAPGPLSRFLGFWTVLIQAAFSFFGAEVPGVAGSEVISASKNIPRAVRRIWIRILLFYILSVFVAGLLVPHDACELYPSHEPYQCRPYLKHIISSASPGHKSSASASLSSPFVIALQKAGQTTARLFLFMPRLFSKVVNAGFVSSAWSAATSDIYISSRYMFFLARCRHAPQFCGRLFRRTRMSTTDGSDHDNAVATPPSEWPTVGEDETGPTRTSTATTDGSAEDREAGYMLEQHPSRASLTVPIDSHRSPAPTGSGILPLSVSPCSCAVSHDSQATTGSSDISVSSVEDNSSGAVSRPRTPQSNYDKTKTVPWVGVLVAGLVGCLAFLGSSTKGNGHTTAAVQAFNYLSAMTSIAALQSWICMLITYLAWYRGARIAMRERPGFKDTKEAEFIREHEKIYQPYLAIYGLVMCFLILIFNGVGVFYNSTTWVIAYPSCDPPGRRPEPGGVSPVAKFITSYLPLPIFVLLFCSYKLIHQTRIVRWEDMPFEPGMIAQSHTDPSVEDNAEEIYSQPVPRDRSKWYQARFLICKLWYFLF